MDSGTRKPIGQARVDKGTPKIDLGTADTQTIAAFTHSLLLTNRVGAMCRRADVHAIEADRRTDTVRPELRCRVLQD
jgi:hypothetical protein